MTAPELDLAAPSSQALVSSLLLRWLDRLDLLSRLAGVAGVVAMTREIPPSSQARGPVSEEGADPRAGARAQDAGLVQGLLPAPGLQDGWCRVLINTRVERYTCVWSAHTINSISMIAHLCAHAVGVVGSLPHQVGVSLTP